ECPKARIRKDTFLFLSEAYITGRYDLISLHSSADQFQLYKFGRSKCCNLHYRVEISWSKGCVAAYIC
ncbi:hypothetical protein Droror1_Dr00026774, partial [Drosera rotundifolia]